ncbi:unnamed protein product [Mortierella alpina]
MQVRAPLVLERIFDDFFADSVLHLQEEQQRRRQRQAQRQRLNKGSYQLSQAIAASAGAKPSCCGSESIAIQRLESLEQHKDAEAARRRAKWEAIRMLGVLYALDKTHVGPSSSSNALVLCGATDVVEPTPPSTTVTPASVSASASAPAPTPCVPSTSVESISTSIHPPRQLCTRASSLSKERRTMRTFDPYEHTFTGVHGDSISSLDRQHSGPEACLAPLDLDPLRYFRPRRGMRKRYSPTTERYSTLSPLSAPTSDSLSLSCSFSLQSRSPLSTLLPRCSTVPPSSSSDSVHLNRSTPSDQWAAQDASESTAWSSDTEDRATLGSRRYTKRATRSRLLGGRVCATSVIESSGQHQEGLPHPVLGQDNAIQSNGRPQPPFVEVKAPILEPMKADVTLENKRMELTNEDMHMSVDRVMEQSQQQQPPQPLQHRRYQIPNRVDKIAFLTKYTDRMHLKLRALEIKDWGQADIQRKKTYQLMIQHNDKTGEKDLVDFYLGRYGGSVPLQDGAQDQELQQHTVAAVAAG